MRDALFVMFPLKTESLEEAFFNLYPLIFNLSLALRQRAGAQQRALGFALRSAGASGGRFRIA